MPRNLARLLVLACALAWGALPRTARAGHIEVGPDGTTIITVTVAGLPDPTNNSVYSRADVAAVKLFVKKFPEIFARKYRDRYRADPKRYGNYDWDRVEVRLKPFSGIWVTGVESDLLAIAGGMAPEVLYINFRKSDNYIRNGFLHPLDEYIERLTPEEREKLETDRVHPRVWEVIRRKGPDGDLRTWALPYGGTPLGKVLMFRKDLFDLHNLRYPDADWTWDDFFHAVKTIADPGRGIYGFNSAAGRSESWHWITFLWSAGGEVMEYNPETDLWRCVFDTPEAVTALDFYLRLTAEKWIDENGAIRRGYTAKDGGDGSSTLWQRGQIGMQFNYITEQTLATFNSEMYGIAPVPLGPTGIRGAELNSTMFGLFAEIRDPAVRDAAWEYIYFLDSDPAMRARTDLLVEGGMGQFVMPKYLERFGYEDFLRMAPKGWNEIYEIALEQGRPEPYGKNSNFAYDQMSIPIQLAEYRDIEGFLPGRDRPEERRAALQAILSEAVANANEIMIGDIPPAERTRRRVIAVVVLLAIIAAFSFVFRKIWRIFTPVDAPGAPGRRRAAWDFGRYKWAYLILVPAVGTILVWSYIPLAAGSAMAFLDYQILRESAFVGLDNFGDLIVDSHWWETVWNALRYSLLTIALTFLPPMVLAILLQEVPRGKLLFRVIYYLPAVISGLVTMLLWKMFYRPSESGVLNRIVLNIPAIGFVALGLVLLLICLAFARRLWFHQRMLPMFAFVAAGLILFFSVAAFAKPIMIPRGEEWSTILANFLPRLFAYTPESYRWLQDPNTAMVACVIPMVWAGMGPGCLIYLAALKGIPDDFYEAADIDGATFIDKILFVVFPTLKALLIINFVGAFISSWYTSTGNILVMTGGDAATRTETAGLFIWYKAFAYLSFGPATAAAWILAFMLIGFTLYQLQILSRVEFRAAGGK